MTTLVSISPEQYRDLLGTPRDRWKAHYRRERMARSGRRDPPMRVEVGEWRGLWFGETDRDQRLICKGVKP